MNCEIISDYKKAIETFEKIPSWKDAGEKIVACKKKIEEIKSKEESDRLEALRKAEEDKIAAEKSAKKGVAIGALVGAAAGTAYVFADADTKRPALVNADY